MALRAARLRICAMAAVGVVAITAPAHADAITIASGFFGVGGTFGVDFVLDPEGGAAGFVGEGMGAAPSGFDDFFCRTCSPARTSSTLHITFSPIEVADPTSNSACPGCGYAGDFTFSVRPVAVPYSDQTLLSSFTMTGILQAFAPGTTNEVVRRRLAGGGIARISERSVYFDFKAQQAPTPTPEPASVLLVLSGIAMVARCRIRD